MRVLALNADEGWARDVSETIAAKVRDVAEHEGRELTMGTAAFIDDHIGRAIQVSEHEGPLPHPPGSATMTGAQFGFE